MSGPGSELSRRIAVARGDEPADLVLAGGRVFSVFTREFLEVDVAIAGERVAGLGRYEGRETVDCTGLSLVPGFIDGHMHVESTKLTPGEFARAVVPLGTTTVVADPHEIANVLGMEGVRALLSAADQLPLDIYAMVSSCVPASALETSGHHLTSEDVAELIRTEPRVLGLAELMNFPAVVAGDPEVLAKVEAAGDRHVDGHAPGLTGPGLNAYAAAGVGSDHESTTYEEALEKRRLGMWVMIREGSAARNLDALLPLVLAFGPEHCMLVTDDREPHDLVSEGHVNHAVRRAVELGCRVEDALVMASLHPAAYHRLHRHGAIAPGYLADVVALPDLRSFHPRTVWKRGRMVADGGRALPFEDPGLPSWALETMRAPRLAAESLRIPSAGRPVRVIEVRPGQIVTGASVETPLLMDGLAVADPSRDLAKIAVVDRHRASGRMGVGFVRGFGLRRGALGSTVAHDAHNLMLVGSDDADMTLAASRLTELGGGQVVVAGGHVLAELPLPVGGLMSLLPFEQVAERSVVLERAAAELGVTLRAPFMALSFLALSVIPSLKVTDLGLVDGERFELVPLET